MHPEVLSEKPGICQICGMNLVKTKRAGKGKGQRDPEAHAAHGNGAGKHAGHSIAMFRNKFWVVLALSVPVVLYSDITVTLTGFLAPEFPGSQYLPLTLSTIIFFYGGWVFLRGAYQELAARLPGMMTLIALAVLTAYSYSVYVDVFGGGRDLFWELSTLVTVMLLGHWMEMRAVSGAQAALKELSKLLPDEAEVIRDGKTETVALSELKQGDMVLVKPGGKVPADGEVTEGQSEVNEAMVTGESKPVGKEKGDEVVAGTVNGDGSLKVKVTKIGEQTFLAGVMRLVEEAQASKSRLQLLSDRAAFYLTVVAVVGGILTLFVWLALRDPAFAIERSVAVLVIACPHALGLAIPLVAAISTSKAAASGFLVRQRLALEAARNIDVVLFDKTGTLTKGEYGVVDVIVDRRPETGDSRKGTGDRSTILQLAGAVESHSEHPAAKAIVKKAKEEKVEQASAKDFRRLPGRGVEGEVKGKKVLVGGSSILEDKEVPDELKQQVKQHAQAGKTIIYVLSDSELLGAIVLADLIRDESRQAVKDLKDKGYEVAMITGDAEEVAAWVAEELGIEKYFAKVLPEKKSEKVKELKREGRRVAMVGDGVNDAPALVEADLGIAIGAGTNVAIESAGIILVRNDPRDIVKIIKLSKLTYRKMLQNLFWAAGYNVVALPLAAGVLAGAGIVLQPAVAALFMSLSTVIVAVNALLLRKKEL